MTRQEAVRIHQQESILLNLGFTTAEAEQLRRISMTLHRWHEGECGSDHRCLVRGRMVNREFVYDDDGAAYWEVSGMSGPNRYYRTPDRETGAKRRLAAIIRARNERITPKDEDGRLYPLVAPLVSSYIQTDPRGAALYILRPGDVPEGAAVGAYYHRGVCVY